MAFKLLTVVLLVCIFSVNARKIRINNCDSRAPIQIKDVNLKSSYPIHIKPGARISASGEYYNSYTSTRETLFRVKVTKLEKYFGFGWLGGFKSVLGLVQGHIPKTVKCGDIEDISPIPLCPGDQGDQTFDATFAVPSDFKIPGGAISGLIGSGKYKVSAEVLDNATGKRIVCVKDVVGEIKL